METTPGVTLQEALGLPALRRALPEVVAGRAGTGRSIRWVHATERIDVGQLLRAGDLLLLAGVVWAVHRTCGTVLARWPARRRALSDP